MKLFRSSLLPGLSTLGVLTTFASGAVVQTNYGTGDGTLPGGSPIVAANNLLSTSLASASRTGADDLTPNNQYFYGEDNGGSIPVVLSRLYDGQFGEAGGDSSASVLPNQVSLTFNLDLLASPAGYDLTSIRTYAGWDDGRDGQQYTVEYSTASDPGIFLPLASVTRFDNPDFPQIEREIEDDDGNPTGEYEMVPYTDEAATLVWLQADSGLLAQNVGALRFNFSGVENSGTGYREFVIEGSAVAAVPEPATLFGTLGLLAGGLGIRRRTSRRR